MARYKSIHTGPQIDSGVSRALPGGEIDAALDSKAEIEFLDNVDFTDPIAQAGVGGNHGSVAYALDRWKLISGTVSASSNGLTLNGTIRQILEKSIGFTVIPSIEMHSGTATIAYDDSTKYCDITSSGGTIKRPHLGLREITDWAKMPVPNRETELLRCQTHFIRMRSSSVYGSFGMCAAVATALGYMAIYLPVAMRTPPVLVQHGAITIYGWSSSITLSAGDMVGNALTVGVAPSGSDQFTVGGAYETFINNDATAYLDFISDL